MKVINFFGGPGAGKSTLAAKVFVRMKCERIRVELVPEFVKGLVYSGATFDIENQLYIFTQQERQLRRLIGKVDYAIVDSPLPLSIIYAQGKYAESWFERAVLDIFGTYTNINFFVRRQWEYEPYGRYQTEDEAMLIDDRVLSFLETRTIPFTHYSETAMRMSLQ